LWREIEGCVDEIISLLLARLYSKRMRYRQHN
jgi:hypothetical protein